MALRDRTEGAGTLVSQVSAAIRRQILGGAFPPGTRLPSEAQLTAAHGVSRTVIREAIAALRADGLVQPRQGAGVFVLDPPAATAPALAPAALDQARLSSILEVLEIRAGVEIEAAGLAAQRRSPAQEEELALRQEAVRARLQAGEPTNEADFALHLAIADATNNPRFREFLEFFGQAVIPCAVLGDEADPADPTDHVARIDREHARIVAAISDGEAEAARAAMRLHLRGSQARYRALLRTPRRNDPPPDS